VRGYLEATMKLYADKRLSPPNGWVYSSPEDFVLRHGVEFPVKGKPKGTRANPIRMGRARNCYGNAANMVLRQRDRSDDPERFRYVEGFAMGDYFPMQHAWVLDTSDDHVFDLTWRPGEREPIYLGVVFPTDVLLETIRRKWTYGMLDDRELYKREWRYGA
jgi:hypothetical protein